MTRGPAERTPSSTYRLQLTPEFGFAQAAMIVGYLSRLGVSHLYLSPVLQAAPGSTHGYDVVDHSRISADLGGQEGFDRLVEVAHEHGLGLVVDVVPNHMCIPTPAYLNAVLWAVLRDGPSSTYATWFDIDWSAGRPGAQDSPAILLPVLGQRLDQCLKAGEITVGEHAGEPVLQYADQVFPLRPGTADLDLDELLQQQYYRLAHWRLADEELNYRRFFDVDTLAGLRVEHAEVFAATHELLVQSYADGSIDGFRIDHPDGLADPGGYLRRLREASGGAWVVVEKVLEGAEPLPEDWPCAGTTGYDALWRLQGLFLQADGMVRLRRLWHRLIDQEPDDPVKPTTSAEVISASKRYVVEGVLGAEVNRIVAQIVRLGALDLGLRDFSRARLAAALREFLIAFPLYRAYVRADEPAPERSVAAVREAATTATDRRSDLTEEIALLADLALHQPRGRTPEITAALRWDICTRIQQTTGPVLAKGVEDTAYYRWFPLAAQTEVGADPTVDGVSAERLHAWAAARVEQTPAALTATSTHDTKRSEDVRARLCVLSEVPDAWSDVVARCRAATHDYRPRALDAATEYLVWQTLFGAWPIESERLVRYLDKATREAKTHTSWTAPDVAYDEAVQAFARRARADQQVTGVIERLVRTVAPYERAVVLGQRLLHLTVPGVPDLYQGCELVDHSLVDPDNRRAVDYERREETLQRLLAGGRPDDLAEEKLWITHQALRCRAEQPGCFLGPNASYRPLVTGSPHAFGFLRGGTVATVVTRLVAGLHTAGGWGAAAVELPTGQWNDVLTHRIHDVGSDHRLALGDLFTERPVSLLQRV